MKKLRQTLAKIGRPKKVLYNLLLFFEDPTRNKKDYTVTLRTILNYKHKYAGLTGKEKAQILTHIKNVLEKQDKITTKQDNYIKELIETKE